LSLAVPTRRVTSQSFLKGLGKTFVHKSFPKSFFENHSMGQALHSRSECHQGIPHRRVTQKNLAGKLS